MAKISLTDYAVVRLSGADAKDFMQAQFTGDLGLLSHSRHLLTSWCAPQGRVLHTFYLFEFGGDFYVLIDASAAAQFMQRLSLFVLRAAVTLEDDTAAWHVWGFVAEPHRALPKALPETPSFGAQYRLSAHCVALSIGVLTPRYIVCEPRDEDTRCGETDDDAALDWPAWRALDLRDGLPISLAPQLSGEFLPQELNLDLLAGLSFEKGCFPGQEIVARVKYRGALKRRMLLATGTGSVPEPGARITHPDDARGRSRGQIVAAVRDAHQGHRLLAVVETAALNAPLRTSSATPLNFDYPPYWPDNGADAAGS